MGEREREIQGRKRERYMGEREGETGEKEREREVQGREGGERKKLQTQKNSWNFIFSCFNPVTLS